MTTRFFYFELMREDPYRWYDVVRNVDVLALIFFGSCFHCSMVLRWKTHFENAQGKTEDVVRKVRKVRKLLELPWILFCFHLLLPAATTLTEMHWQWVRVS